MQSIVNGLGTTPQEQRSHIENLPIKIKRLKVFNITELNTLP